MSSKVDRQHESKQREESVRGGKDDMKEQAYQAKHQVKAKAADLKEQVVSSGAFAQASTLLQQGLDTVKEKVGLNKDASTDELVEEVQGQAGEQWEQVKSRGNKQLKKAADVVDSKLDQNLTKEQKAKLQKGVQQAKKAGAQGIVQAQGGANRLLDMTMSAPALRPAKRWIQKNNLALPALVLLGILTLWSTLSIIRLVNNVLSPSVPEFDIHSKDAMMDWARYHAGDLKGQALDARDSLTARAASFLANNDYDAMKSRAIDYKDIGLHKLGLREPTWGEWAWAKLTGRPITWQDRVESVMSLTKKGLAAKAGKEGLIAGMKHLLHKQEPEPTLKDRAQGVYDSIRATVYPEPAAEPSLKDRAYDVYDSIRSRVSPQPVEPSTVDSIKSSLRDGVDSVRSKLPSSAGGYSAEELKQRAYDATHQSTLGSIKSTAEYVKNRVLHGSQEAAHIAQDRANEIADKAKYKAGL